MIEYYFHNINIISSVLIDIEIKKLEVELGGNRILDACPKYKVYIEKRSMPDDQLEGLKRITYNPLLKKSVWLSEKGEIEVEIQPNVQFVNMNLEFHIFIKDYNNIYSILRAKVCEIIRKSLFSFYDFAIHAASIIKDNRMWLIIGAKGTGKTSAALYARHEGWQILTDELIFWGDKGFDVLQRFPALSLDTITMYFSKDIFEYHCEIQGLITEECKKLLKISLFNPNLISDIQLEKVILLTDPMNEYFDQNYKKDIINSNLILYGPYNDKVIRIIRDIEEKGIMTNIKYFCEKIME